MPYTIMKPRMRHRQFLSSRVPSMYLKIQLVVIIFRLEQSSDNNYFLLTSVSLFRTFNEIPQ